MKQEEANWFQRIIIPGRITLHNDLWISNTFLNAGKNWSFSTEWKSHAETKQQKTWDMTATERLQNFFHETKTDAESIQNKTVLDAGCGNGQLTRAIAEAGAFAVGIDMQPHLPASWRSDRLQFVQADFDDPPFHDHSFDIIIANGSIHHTPNVKRSFHALSKLVKDGGRLYVWVYKRPEKWKDKILLWWLDVLRFFISRFPVSLQKITVNIFTYFFYWLSRIKKGENSGRTISEIRVNVFDAFTPRFRNYHTPGEITSWFKKESFISVFLTHDNSKYGFGMVGVKTE